MGQEVIDIDNSQEAKPIESVEPDKNQEAPVPEPVPKKTPEEEELERK